MIDWTISRYIARLAAGSEPLPDLGVDVQKMSKEAERHLVEYTQLHPTTELPSAEILDRREWAEMNLDVMSQLLDPVSKRMGVKLEEKAKKKTDSTGKNPSPVTEMFLKAAGAFAVSAEVGAVLGYMSQRVLGQVEAALLTPTGPTRLVFVGPNLDQAVARMNVDRESFIGWVVLHELTHVYQFVGVPWLRGHLRDQMQEYLKTVELRLDDEKASSIPDIEQIQAAISGGGIMALVQSKEQREIMQQLQATMALVEGYAEHVMDAVGEDVLPQYTGLRDAMDSRRGSRSAPERLLQKLLGLDMKMKQYEDGKVFCDHVADHYGIDMLNRCWDSSENIPTGDEVADADLWVRRINGGSLPEKRAVPERARSKPPEEPTQDSHTVDSRENPVRATKASEVELNPKGEAYLRDLEDEEYLRALNRDQAVDPQLKVEMASWLPGAQESGYIELVGDISEGRYRVTKQGLARLAQILSKES